MEKEGLTWKIEGRQGKLRVDKKKSRVDMDREGFIGNVRI